MLLIPHAEILFKEDLLRIFPNVQSRPGHYLVEAHLDQFGEISSWIGITPIAREKTFSLAGSVPRRTVDGIAINGVLEIAVHPEHIGILHWSPQSFTDLNARNEDWPHDHFPPQDSWHRASTIRAFTLTQEGPPPLNDDFYGLARVSRLGVILKWIEFEKLTSSGMNLPSRREFSMSHKTSPSDTSFLTYVIRKGGQYRPVWYPVDIRRFEFA